MKVTQILLKGFFPPIKRRLAKLHNAAAVIRFCKLCRFHKTKKIAKNF